MKKHTFLLATMFTSLLATNSFAQNAPLLHLVSEMKTFGAAQITLHVADPVEVETWDHDYLKVEIVVTKSNLSRARLQSLAALGLFKVESFGNPANLILNMPGQLLPLQVGGVKPINEMVFKITVPHHTNVTKFGEVTDLLAGK